MKIILIGLLLSLSVNTVVHAQSGLITIQSTYDASTTAERLVSVLQEKGMTIFARIDHSQGAANVGIKLRPTEVIIFGNPKVGSPLMLCSQNVAIDLPQKALVYEEANGEVWLTYNDPKYLVERHSISGCDATIEKIDKALANFARKATQP
ncbi:DUF302 domain-containing protein [Photobacterium kasasachensis]|uniref:DUF302 domain-containing protein n=1 Tax=Photobacterium kasasachensis TaxID=2910240 RepID=UPI003D0BFD3E